MRTNRPPSKVGSSRDNVHERIWSPPLETTHYLFFAKPSLMGTITISLEVVNLLKHLSSILRQNRIEVIGQIHKSNYFNTILLHII